MHKHPKPKQHNIIKHLSKARSEQLDSVVSLYFVEIRGWALVLKDDSRSLIHVKPLLHREILFGTHSFKPDDGDFNVVAKPIVETT